MIVTAFGFKRASDPKSIAHNCTLVAKLKTNAAFLYKVSVPVTIPSLTYSVSKNVGSGCYVRIYASECDI